MGYNKFMGNTIKFSKKSIGSGTTGEKSTVSSTTDAKANLKNKLSTSLKLLKHKSESTQKSEDKLVAVIVSLENGGSYDDLFTTVEQKSLEGTRV